MSIESQKIANEVQEEILKQKTGADRLEPTELKFKEEITVKTIKIQEEGFDRIEKGYYVAVRPAKEKRTYLGVMIGDAPLYIWGQFIKDRSELEIIFHRNPAIFVPDLMKVILGCESWWTPLKTPEDLKQITDADINGVWYVKALKALAEKQNQKLGAQ